MELDSDGVDDPTDDCEESIRTVKVKEQIRRLNILDPAVDFVYQKACEAAQSGKMRLQQSYDDLIAWKFTPDRYFSPSSRDLSVAFPHDYELIINVLLYCGFVRLLILLLVKL